MKNLLHTVEDLAGSLDLTPKTINVWGEAFGINFQNKDVESQDYYNKITEIFKKTKSLILNGYSLDEVKHLLSAEIMQLDSQERIIEGIIVEKAEENSNADEKLAIFKENIDKNVDRADIVMLFEIILKELKQYADRAVEAEKQVFLLEDYENRIKQDYHEITSEVKQLKTQLEEKEQKLKDYEEQKKRLNLMEIQLKIMQIERNKKKFWQFWK